MPKAGKIIGIPPSDELRGSFRLRVLLLDDDGQDAGFVDLVADDIVDEKARLAVQIFAYNVGEAERKKQYIAQHHGNDERVLLELREDFYEWNLRLRKRGQKRYDGLGDKAVAEWHLQR
jgi:hypothetical protein